APWSSPGWSAALADRQDSISRHPRCIESPRLLDSGSSMHALARLSPEIRQYLLITGNYWAFTLTDGALRMLVVLHFHALGYSPLQIAALFLFYEFFGVVTNLIGGWLGARLGL